MSDPLNSAVAAVTGQTPTAGTSSSSGGLAGQAAAQNIAAAPSLDALAQIISGINQKAYLSAPGRQAQVTNIQNELAGNLDPQTVQSAQLEAAQRYGGAGFGADSGAWQSAVQRATGISRQALESQGATELNSLYSQMPVTDASQFAVTPALLEKQQEAAAQLSEQRREFDVTTKQGQEQFMASLQEKANEAAQQMKATASALAEQQREYDLTHSATVANQIAQLQEQARQANQTYQLESTKVQLQNQQFAQSQLQQQAQFAQSQGQNQNQFMASLQEKANEAAQAAAQASASLAEQQREYDLTRSATVADQIARLQEQSREADQSYQLESTKLQLAQSQFAQTQAQQQSQYAQTQAQQQAQFAAQLAQQQAQLRSTTAQQQAQLYAQTYGSIPGYNQYGMYTGQTGTYPSTSYPTTTATPVSATTTASTPSVTPQQALAQFDAGFPSYTSFMGSIPTATYKR
jgi:hypothetical protein